MRCKALISLAVSALVLACAAPALATAPTTTITGFHDQFVDSTSCAFPVAVKVDLTRRTTTFANGDATRHLTFSLVQTANGHVWLERDVFDVFISSSDPANWKLTGRFGQTWVDGKLVYLQSGLITYDPFTDTLSDPHPGPLGVYPDFCTALAP